MITAFIITATIARFSITPFVVQMMKAEALDGYGEAESTTIEGPTGKNETGSAPVSSI